MTKEMKDYNFPTGASSHERHGHEYEYDSRYIVDEAILKVEEKLREVNQRVGREISSFIFVSLF